MDNQEISESLARRRATYQKMARLQVIREDKARVIKPSTQPCLWMSDRERELSLQEDTKYSEIYRSEYEITPVMDGDKPATSEENGIGALIRGVRGGRGKGPLRRSIETESSCGFTVVGQAFEQASTIMPPSLMPDNDFDTNISADEIRDTYFQNYQTNTALPIHDCRSSIVNSINSYSIIIIEGETGCGKTTQVPLYILEHALLERRCPKSPVIYVTQPRRIAARSIAKRVCEEHGWQLGSLVGYQVSLEKAVGENTVLVFCTAGVLLQKLIQEKSLGSFTHIIVDEAHERDSDTDLLLMMIRTLMKKEQPIFRLIVMSASMDSAKLENYFTFKTNFGHQACILPSKLNISGRRNVGTSLQIIHLDKIKPIFGVEVDGVMPEFQHSNPELHTTCLKTAVRIIIHVIPKIDTFCENTKSTLVFLPGYAEICKMDRLLRTEPGAKDKIDIIAIHSCISISDQLRVFEKSPAGTRKVILATNIAESSITVPDVGFIVDFCLNKVLMKDPVTKFPPLKLQWSTQDRCTQRAGRTGRCNNGKVFRLIPNVFFERLQKYAAPELLTAPLELSVLRVKSFDMGELKALFAIVMDPPPFGELRTAVLELKQIGALAPTYKGKATDLDGDITELGRILTALPIDVHLSKLIVIANIFDVMEDAIVIAACLSTNRSIIKHTYRDPVQAYENKINWSRGSHSDLFVCLDVYREFEELTLSKQKNQQYLSLWCRRNGLDERKLADVMALVDELQSRLGQLNLLSVDQPNRERNPGEDFLMLKIAFCAAFYPNYFISLPFDVKQIKKDLCNLDPAKTVIIHNFPVNQVALYRDQVLDKIRAITCENIDFITDTSRALLVLNDEDEIASEDDVLKEVLKDCDTLEPYKSAKKSVYRALKMGDMADRIEIREYNDIAAFERLRFYNDQKSNVSRSLGVNKLLPSWVKIVDRDPDNQHLAQLTYEEQIERGKFYVEVSFDHVQTARDSKLLADLETVETEQEKAAIEEQLACIYRDSYRMLRGPDSPIRIKFRPVLEKSRPFSVEVDPNSINSILLDPDYETDREQMLVAAAVHQSARGRVIARDTTLMPNIRDLASLMSLLFAQQYKLDYDRELECFLGAIYGLGWDENGTPIDEMYQVKEKFTTKMTADDMDLIKRARELIVSLLKFTEIQNVGKPQAAMQRQLRDIVLALLRRKRAPMSPIGRESDY